ncbi:hypothetical protein SBADM41S_02979 [Streptomyces badius]
MTRPIWRIRSTTPRASNGSSLRSPRALRRPGSTNARKRWPPGSCPTRPTVTKGSAPLPCRRPKSANRPGRWRSRTASPPRSTWPGFWSRSEEDGPVGPPAGCGHGRRRVLAVTVGVRFLDGGRVWRTRDSCWAARGNRFETVAAARASPGRQRRPGYVSAEIAVARDCWRRRARRQPVLRHWRRLDAVRAVQPAQPFRCLAVLAPRAMSWLDDRFASWPAPSSRGRITAGSALAPVKTAVPTWRARGAAGQLVRQRCGPVYVTGSAPLPGAARRCGRGFPRAVERRPSSSW